MSGTHWVERFSPSRLRELRKQRGYTQVEFAARVGQVQAAYSRYETGTTRPNRRTLLKFAKKLAVEVDELLEPGSVDMELLRLRRGLSMQDAAERLGISRNKYSRIEAGEVAISPELLRRLARLLKVEPHELARLLVVDSPD